jgi:hypothetical protein
MPVSISDFSKQVNLARTLNPAIIRQNYKQLILPDYCRCRIELLKNYQLNNAYLLDILH